MCTPFSSISAVRFEIPKSEILQIPEGSTRILSAFRSWNFTLDGKVKKERISTHSMNDTVVVEVFKALQYLTGEGTGNLVLELAVFTKAACY